MRGEHGTRRWPFRIAGALVLVVALAGLAVLFLPRLVERLAIARLESAGIPAASLRIADLGWTRTEITDLRLGSAGELTVGEAIIAYTPLGLLRGRVDRILLRDLRLALDLDGPGPPLGSLDGLLGGHAESGPAATLPETRIETGRIALSTQAGSVAIPITGTLQPQPEGGLRGALTIPAGRVEGAGLAAGSLSGTVHLALEPEAPLTASAHLDLADLAAAGTVIETGSLDLRIEGESGTTRLDLEEAGDRLALHAAATIDDLGGTPQGTAKIEAEAAADSALWRLAGLPAPTRDRLVLSATLSGRLSIGERNFAIDRGDATLTGLALGGVALAPVALEGTLSGGFDDFAGRLRIAAAAPTLATASLRADDLALDAETDIAFADGRLTARLRDGSRLRAERLALPGRLAFDGPLRLPLAADGASLTVDLASSQNLRIDYALKAGPATLAARLRPDASAPIAVGGRLSALSAAGAWSEAEGHQATLRLTLSDLAEQADPPLLAPLTVEAEGRLSGSRIDFTARAAAGARAVLTVAGHHDLRDGTGGAEVKLPPIAFSPGTLEPSDLAPILKGRIEQATGTLALAGDLSWTPRQGITPDLQLLLKELSFATPQATVARLNAVVRLNGLAPLSTPLGQTLALGLIDIGVPLTDGLVTFRLDPSGLLVVKEGRLRFAGGTVAVEPVAIDLAAAETALRLVVTQVELSELLALADIDGLSATGRLDGRIPLRLDANGVVIAGGELKADAPGRLSYDPARPPAALQGQGETVSLLLSALTDFEYRALRLTVDRDTDGEMVVAVHIEGKNPNFYDGYPVELNFNISGKLEQILRRSLVGYRIPDAIRERLSKFPQ